MQLRSNIMEEMIKKLNTYIPAVVLLLSIVGIVLIARMHSMVERMYVDTCADYVVTEIKDIVSDAQYEITNAIEECEYSISGDIDDCERRIISWL